MEFLESFCSFWWGSSHPPLETDESIRLLASILPTFSRLAEARLERFQAVRGELTQREKMAITVLDNFDAKVTILREALGRYDVDPRRSFTPYVDRALMQVLTNFENTFVSIKGRNAKATYDQIPM